MTAGLACVSASCAWARCTSATGPARPPRSRSWTASWRQAAPSWIQRTTTGSGTARPGRASGSSDAGCGPAAGRPGYSCVQQQHTYLLAQPEPGQLNLITEELLDYARSEQLTLLAYSPLLAGAYAHPDRSVPAAYQHAANHPRLATLRDVAAEHGATPNQVVLAWLLHRQPAIIPVPGASSVAQLDEILAATELKLNAATLDRLDRAGRLAS